MTHTQQLVFPVVVRWPDNSIAKYDHPSELWKVWMSSGAWTAILGCITTVFDSAGRQLQFSNFETVPPSSLVQRLLGVSVVHPVDAVWAEVSVAELKAAIFSSLTETFGLDDNFHEDAMKELFDRISVARTLEAVVAAIPVRLPPG